MNEFNKNWLNLMLEYKNNPDVTFDLSQNDIRILLTYIEVLQSKIDKANEIIKNEKENMGYAKYDSCLLLIENVLKEDK